MRQRGQLAPIAAILLVVGVMLATTIANALPVHHPTLAEQRAADRIDVIAQRRARIVELTAEGDHCVPARAHELARALVFDGQSARAYADDYLVRCGDDPAMAHWRDAPIAKRRQ